MQNDSLVPKHPVSAVKEAAMLRTLGNQAKRVGDFTKNIFYDKGKFNPVVGIPKAIKRGYESTAAATSPTKQKNMIADALENMRSGKAVDDVVTNPNQSKGLIGALRNRGFLSVGRKTTGRYTDAQTSQINEFLKQKGVLQANPKGGFRVNEKLSQQELQKALTEARSKFKADPNALTRMDKAKDFAYNVLPGEKTLVVGGAGLGAAGEFSSKETAEGRKKSLAERLGRAGTIGAVETIAAPLGIARRFGTLGVLGETGAAFAPTVGMSVADKAIGNPAMKKQAESIPSYPRLAIRGAIK